MIHYFNRIDFRNMPKCPGVYRLWNTVTGQSYIGATCNYVRDRARQHSDRLRLGTHENPLLMRSYRLHGHRAFKFEFIEKCGRSLKVYDRESYWIKTLKPELNQNTLLRRRNYVCNVV